MSDNDRPGKTKRVLLLSVQGLSTLKCFPACDHMCPARCRSTGGALFFRGQGKKKGVVENYSWTV